MNAFTVASLIQLIRAFQAKMRMKEFEDEADLFLGASMFNNEQLIQRLRDTKVFSNVYYADDSDYKSFKLMHLMYGPDNKALRKNRYKKLISFNVENGASMALFNLNKDNPGFEYHCMEDSAMFCHVYIPQEYKHYHPYYLMGIRHECFHITTWWTSCPEFMEIPSVFTDTVKKLPAISIEDQELRTVLNYVYDYPGNGKLDSTDLLIMEEAHHNDGRLPGNEDFELYKAIRERYPDKVIYIKLHPRTRVNRFDGIIDLLTIDKIPWELYEWNIAAMKQRDVVQIGITCSTLFSGKFAFNYEGRKICLAELFNGKIPKVGNSDRLNGEIIAKIRRFKDLYRIQDNFVMPRTQEEVFEVLDKLFV